MQRFLERTQLDSISSRSINDTFSTNDDVVLLGARANGAQISAQNTGKESTRCTKTKICIAAKQKLLGKTKMLVLPGGLFRGARSSEAYSRVPVKGKLL